MAVVKESFKSKKNKRSIIIAIIISLFILWMYIVNYYFGSHPVLQLFQYLADKNYLWLVPLIILVIYFILRHNLNVKEKLSIERIEMFNATMRTIQDILQNSSSSMQLLILDMKEKEVHEEIVQRAEKNIEELKSVIKTLSDIDPTSIQLEELNRKMSIIKMKE